MIASIEASTSAVVVDQPETEIRIARRSCQRVPPSQAVPSCLDGGDHGVRPGVAGRGVGARVLEPDQDLVRARRR